MRTDSPLLQFYYSNLKKFGPGGATTDGCPPGFNKTGLGCLNASGQTPDQAAAFKNTIKTVVNPQKKSAGTPYKTRSQQVKEATDRAHRQNFHIGEFSNQATISQGQASTPDSERIRAEKLQQYVNAYPYAQVNALGDVERKQWDRSMETGLGDAYTPAGRFDRGMTNIANGLDAATMVTGAGELANLGYKGLKGVITNSMETGLLSKAHRFNPNALTDKMLFNKPGVVNRQIFGDEAFNTFLNYGPTTRPGVHEGTQLIEHIRAPKSDIISGSGETFKVSNTMENKTFKYPYFQEGDLWFKGKQRQGLTSQLGKERIITTPKSDVWFMPAGESSIMHGDNLSKELIDSYSGGRRVLIPGSEYANSSMYSVYEPHWWKGYKQVEIPKQIYGGNIPKLIEGGPGDGIFDSIVSTLNPYNWGVADYSKSGSFKNAYADAVKNNRKEFMYNNKRYTTDYKGTEQEQLKARGVTNKQRMNQTVFRKALRNIDQGNAGSEEDDVNEGFHGYPNPFRAIGDLVVGLNYQPDPDYDTEQTDMLNVYAGAPQKNNTLGISNYKPSKTKQNNTSTYYRVNPLNNMMPNQLTQEEFDYVMKNKGFNKDDVNFSYVDKKGQAHNNYRGLGTFTIDAGKDDRGDYVSYYDKWDLNPFSSGKDAPDLSMGAGKPYEIYDRIYYKDYGNGIKKRMYFNDNELGGLDLNSKNFDTKALQRELANRGYNLSKSLIKDKNDYDGILGDETKKAYLDWKSKYQTTKKAYGGDISIPELNTKMPALSIGGSIGMQPRQSPLLDYYLQRTGGKRMIR